VPGAEKDGHMRIIKRLWHTWEGKIDPSLSLAGYIWVLITATTAGAGLIAWASTTWAWYWQTFSWAGVGLAFMVALFVCSLCFYLVALAAWHWRRPTATQTPGTVHQDLDKFASPTITISPPTLQASLYVGEIRFTFGELKTDRHTEISIRVFNGSGRVVEISSISGTIRFNAPNNKDPSRMGELPPPAIRPDTSRTVAQLQEWLLILAQRTPASQADKLVAMLDDDSSILFDLSGLKIEVFARDEPKNIQTLPLWHGVSYSKGNGFGRIIAMSAHLSG
jgi:hypothetical protein